VLLITHEMEVVKRVCDSVALLRDGRVAESGPVGDVVARPDSSLAESLLPAPADRAPGSAAVDVVLLDRDAERSVAAALSGALGNGNARTELEAAVTAAGGPVRVAGGSIEMIGGRRVGRLTLAPEGGAEAATRLAAELRARGARATELAEPRGNGAGATEVGPRADGAP
jgi:D-methionine transport system ATP-binding protein